MVKQFIIPSAFLLVYLLDFFDFLFFFFFSQQQPHGAARSLTNYSSGPTLPFPDFLLG